LGKLFDSEVRPARLTRDITFETPPSSSTINQNLKRTSRSAHLFNVGDKGRRSAILLRFRGCFSKLLRLSRYWHVAFREVSVGQAP